MSTPDLIELIKAIGGAVGAIIGAIGLAYARIAAKQSRQASQQTATTVHVDGELRRKSSAQTAEEALGKVDQLQRTTDTLIARMALLEAGAARRGAGARRAPTGPVPDLEEHDPW